MYSKGVAFVLGILSFVPPFSGLLRYYLKRNVSGTIFTLTAGCCFIGNILDIVQIPQLVREANMRRARRGIELEGPDHSGTGYPVLEYKRREESVEKYILQSAKENHGLTTPGEVALVGGVSIEEAHQALDYLVSKGFAELRVSKTGAIAYYFSDILTGDSADGYEEI